VLASIRAAVRLADAGEAAAVVTLPLQKESLYAAGFAFEGHTDYLAELARRAGHEAEPVMMLVAGDLRTVPVTIHVALSEVPMRLSADMIVRQGRIVARDLAKRFGLEAPRLAVSGLNPHAGEGGRMGTEEETVIRPAVERLQAEGISAFGPLPADTMFHQEAAFHPHLSRPWHRAATGRNGTGQARQPACGDPHGRTDGGGIVPARP